MPASRLLKLKQRKMEVCRVRLSKLKGISRQILLAEIHLTIRIFLRNQATVKMAPVKSAISTK